MGIENVIQFNSALLGKWRWRLLREHGSSWGLVLKSKYGDIFGTPIKRVSNFDSIWWSDLVKVCGENEGGQAPGGHNVISGIFGKG